MQTFAAAIIILSLLLCIFNNSAAHTLRAAALLAVSAALLCGCQGGFSSKETEAKRISADIPQTGNTKRIPEKYFQKAKKQGRVIDFTYETAEYACDKEKISKKAYVYLPSGYKPKDKTAKYDIIYLMHGLGGRSGEFFDKNGGRLKDILDQMIERKKIAPLIAVSVSFYSPRSSKELAPSLKEVRAFHKEFVGDLMPAVESEFRTYAASASQKDLKASRAHRAFGGFSLGSVTTWLEFCYDSDYISCFLPMSGPCWYYNNYGDPNPTRTADLLQKTVKRHNLKKRGYFIYAATGTADPLYSQIDYQMQEILKRREFFTPDHLVYYLKPGGRHDFSAVEEYIFNALPIFFPPEQK